MPPMTQYITADHTKDDTRDEAYDLYAAIGVARRLLDHISGSGAIQEGCLKQCGTDLAQAQDDIRRFISHRRAG